MTEPTDDAPPVDTPVDEDGYRQTLTIPGQPVVTAPPPPLAPPGPPPPDLPTPDPDPSSL